MVRIMTGLDVDTNGHVDVDDDIDEEGVPGAPEEAEIVDFLLFFRCFWPSHHSVLPTLQDGRRATSTPRGPGIPPRRHQKSPGAITSDREAVSGRLLAYGPRQAV